MWVLKTENERLAAELIPFRSRNLSTHAGMWERGTLICPTEEAPKIPTSKAPEIPTLFAQAPKFPTADFFYNYHSPFMLS